MSAARKGIIFSECTKTKLSASKKGNQYWKGRQHSADTIAKMSAAKKGSLLSEEHKAKISEARKGQSRSEKAGRPKISIEVFDTLNNETTVFPSIREAAKSIGCDKSTILKVINLLKSSGEEGPKGKSKLIHKRYQVKEL